MRRCPPAPPGRPARRATWVAAASGAFLAVVLGGNAAFAGAHVAGRGDVAILGEASGSTAAAGYCTSSTGVTVVVDFSALGGDVVIRCAAGPGGTGYSGLDALQAAGFQVEGTRQFGLAFVCRIQGVPDDQDCLSTPPTDAYWGYWYAENGGDWVYSTTGATNRATIAGGFEGWAFSVGGAEGSHEPGVQPHLPGSPTADPEPTQQPGGGTPATSPPPTATPPTATPPTATPPTATPPTGGGPTTPSTLPTTSIAPPSTAPTPSGLPSTRPGPTGHTGPTASGPTATVPTATGPTVTAPSTQEPSTQEPSTRGPSTSERPGQGPGTVKAPTTSKTPRPTTAKPSMSSDGKVRVTGELPVAATDDNASAGSPTTTLIGAGVLVALGLGGGFTAWRRSHRG